MLHAAGGLLVLLVPLVLSLYKPSGYDPVWLAQAARAADGAGTLEERPPTGALDNMRRPVSVRATAVWSRRHLPAALCAAPTSLHTFLHAVQAVAVHNAFLADLGAFAAMCLWCDVPISMTCAEVRQISAQAIISRKVGGAAW